MKQLLSFCESRREEMVGILCGLVRLESPTDDKAAVDRCGLEVQRLLRERGASVQAVSVPASGNHVLARFEGAGRPVLLLGHFDTVWPVGTLGTMPVVERDGCLHGPGVFDMKGGIVVALVAIDAVLRRGGEGRPAITVLLTADEETGSATSRALIEAEARNSRAVLVLEPPLPGGALKTSRKGFGEFEMTVHGAAAHAGIEPEKGANAILELAERLIEVERLQEPARGTTLTVSLVAGGTRSNVVPAIARATIDARATSASEAARVTQSLGGLSARRPGTRLVVSGDFTRPPLERTPHVVRLFEMACDVAHELGSQLGEGATGGCSDGNFTAALGVPTLDGLGAPGDGAHAAHEHVLVDELPGRSALLAGLIGRLGRD
jgi:glutamate carboxypeptidase